MTAKKSLLPPLPKLDADKPLPAEKVCTSCNSDNSATAVFCVNCGADISRVKAKIKTRQRDKKGPQQKQEAHETILMGQPITKMQVPGAKLIAAQKKLEKPINPITKQISDDSVDVVDEEHLQQVEDSAEASGL